MFVQGLSFSSGLKIQAEVWHQFGLPISCSELSVGSFALMAAFGRCKFRFSEASVGLPIQATIGGVASHFRVHQLSPRVFKFFVSSQQVGFFVRRLISFECITHKVFFHLWGWWTKLAQRVLVLLQGGSCLLDFCQSNLFTQRSS